MERNAHIDSLKGLLIILVVFGHALERCYSGGPLFCLLHNALYAFHMPMFILISGYLTRRKPPKALASSSLTLLLTYAIYQGIHHLPLFRFDDNSLYDLLLVPEWTLWYLISLIFWRLLLHITPQRWTDHPVWLLTLSLTVALAAGFIPCSRLLSVQRTLAFLPFFFAGHLLRQHAPSPKAPKALTTGAYVLTAAAALFFILHSHTYYGRYLSLSASYAAPLEELLIRLLVILTAFAICLTVVRLHHTRNFLTRIGRDSLFYYMLHSLILTACVRLFACPSSLLLTLLLTAVIIVVPMPLPQKVKDFIASPCSVRL